MTTYILILEENIIVEMMKKIMTEQLATPRNQDWKSVSLETGKKNKLLKIQLWTELGD